MSENEFTWRDGERTIHFRAGVVADATEILAGHGFADYELLTTERAMGAASVELAEDALCFHHVPPGPVNEVAARLIGEVEHTDLLALGGGRVIDVAKAIAAVRGGRVAALPTTLSGAEMTHIHRLPDGHEADVAGAPRVRARRPAADGRPGRGTAPSERDERARPRRRLALHAAREPGLGDDRPARGTPDREGPRQRARERDPAQLALGSLLCAYALDSALFSLHHVICQSLVRELRIPHAETNATMLPRVLEALIPRAPKQIGALARALGTKRDGLRERVEELGGGPRRLSQLDPDRDRLDAAVKAIMARPELQLTPDVPGEREIRALIEDAW